MENTKRILIYGDSLTWGRIAKSNERYGNSIRFTKVLQSELGPEYEIIEEGLRGRFAKGENPHFPYRDGYQQFPGIYLSQLPLDLLIIFLGTNDTNKKAEKSVSEIAKNLESYIPLTKELSESLGLSTPMILFVAPPYIQEKYLKEDTMFIGGEEKSKKLVPLIKEMTQANNVKFFDSNSAIQTCEIDGVHLDKTANLELGKALAEKIKSLI